MDQAVAFDDVLFAERFLAKRTRPRGLSGHLDDAVLQLLKRRLATATVLEVGCGAGSFANRLCEFPIESYTGVDSSSTMIELAKGACTDHRCEFHHVDILEFQAARLYDLAISVLALHFVENVDAALAKVVRCLRASGEFVLAVRHPLRTCAPGGLMENGAAWALRDYFDEGPRRFSWHDKEVTIYHRTISTWHNVVKRAGFAAFDMMEPQPDPSTIDQQDADHSQVPGTLLFKCTR